MTGQSVGLSGNKASAAKRPGVSKCGLGDTQKVSQFPIRHCKRSEAIQGPQYDRLGCLRRACCGPWIASSQGLLAMTDGGGDSAHDLPGGGLDFENDPD